eukprot:TRINITY_DN814_c0_g1_i2.p1 TRINITY_DN814_c0_g1~~TRINITY_DN814_c0_g1_i2.p1  ORF type:complete len:528 (+),score=141.29 TRINITY_DN814_c0_g1_i2:34-1617(+)
MAAASVSSTRSLLAVNDRRLSSFLGSERNELRGAGFRASSAQKREPLSVPRSHLSIRHGSCEEQPAVLSAKTPSAFPFATFSVSNTNCRTRNVAMSARKRMFDDPFDFGEDPDMEYGEVLSKGKQDALEPRPPTDFSSDKGYLLFPPGHNLEIASLGLYIRGDVRSCVVLVAGGVYENLLFFPLLQLLKNKYPGVRIDVAASERGKQTYELNRNVRRAWVYDVEDPFIVPADYTEFLGKLKNENYDLVMSTRQSGMGHAIFLFLTDSRQRVAYVNPTVNGAGAGVFLTTALRSSSLNLAERGFHMYSELEEFLGSATKFAPAVGLPPLQVNIPQKVADVCREKYAAEGIPKGLEFVVFHGIASASAASMRSLGDKDSGLPLDVLVPLVESVKSKGVQPLVVIPNENDRSKVVEAVGESAKIIKIATPGQLAALVADSAAVVTSNTAALPLALALSKPTVALFGKQETATAFAPADAVGGTFFTAVSSQTGQLSGISVEAAVAAMSSLPIASTSSSSLSSKASAAAVA